MSQDRIEGGLETEVQAGHNARNSIAVVCARNEITCGRLPSSSIHLHPSKLTSDGREATQSLPRSSISVNRASSRSTSKHSFIPQPLLDGHHYLLWYFSRIARLRSTSGFFLGSGKPLPGAANMIIKSVTIPMNTPTKGLMGGRTVHNTARTASHITSMRMLDTTSAVSFTLRTNLKSERAYGGFCSRTRPWSSLSLGSPGLRLPCTEPILLAHQKSQ